MDTRIRAAAAAAAAPTATRAAPASREIFVDWLRIGALLLLVQYHVGMYYVSWPWHIKSPASAEVAAWVEPWMRLTSPWRMSLLFLVSGMASAWMLAGRGTSPPAPWRWLKERARRLGLPLLLGMALIVPPQAYFEVRQFHGYAGSYFEFLGLYFSAHGGFCAAGRGCLVLPTWNHLWFLPYVLAYSALLALWLRRQPQGLAQAAARAPQALRGWRLWAWPLAWMAATRLLLAPVFGQTHALVDDFFLHAQYLAVFLGGAVLARCPALWLRLQQQRHAALALALAAWALLAAAPAGTPWRALPWSVVQVAATMAVFGHAHRHLRRDSAARRWLSQAVFPVYLWHQTVTVVAAVALARWALTPAVEGTLLVALTLLGSFAGYGLMRLLARLWPALGPWFGLARTGAAAAAPGDGGLRSPIVGDRIAP